VSRERGIRFERPAGAAGGARGGCLHIGDLPVPTPAFMPVGTRAAVKTLAAEELEALDARLILANTYHLLLRPGPERVAQLGGLHRFMGWRGGILTDSGGFQVFSLAAFRRIRDEGIEFRSHLDGTRHVLTPESVLEIQEQLGSDIRMVLDVCTPYPAEAEQARAEMQQTLAWAERSRAWWERRPDAGRDGAALFGIVQGGMHPDLREACARRLVALGFDGYALGGFSVGEPAGARPAALSAALGALPEDRPRYLMGVGTPLEILDAIDHGVDLFDCVLPTRNARKGTVFTWQGRVVIKNRVHAEDDRPIDPACGCATCRRYSRAYVRHLFQVGEQLAGRLATIHSLAFYQQLMGRAREAIATGAWPGFLAEMRARWS